MNRSSAIVQDVLAHHAHHRHLVALIALLATAGCASLAGLDDYGAGASAGGSSSTGGGGDGGGAGGGTGGGTGGGETVECVTFPNGGGMPTVETAVDGLTAPARIQADPDFVYFIDSATEGTLRRFAMVTVPATLDSWQAASSGADRVIHNFTLTTSNVVWFERGTGEAQIRHQSTARAGAGTLLRSIAGSNDNARFAASSDDAYVTAQEQQSRRLVLTVTPGAGDFVHDTDLPGAADIAFAGTRIYVASNASITTYDLPRGTTPTTYGDVQGAGHLVGGQSHVYWAVSGKLQRAPLADVAMPEDIATTSSLVSAMGLRNDCLFWTDEAGMLQVVPSDGSADPVVVADLGETADSLVVTTDAIFLALPTRIVRVLVP